MNKMKLSAMSGFLVNLHIWEKTVLFITIAVGNFPWQAAVKCRHDANEVKVGGSFASFCDAI